MNLKKLIRTTDAIEKAYYRRMYGFDNKLEVADWLYSYIKRKFGTIEIDTEQTQNVIMAVQKRYEIEYYSDAEAAVAGLAYDGNVTRKYSFEFNRNFGLYNLRIEKK